MCTHSIVIQFILSERDFYCVLCMKLEIRAESSFVCDCDVYQCNYVAHFQMEDIRVWISSSFSFGCEMPRKGLVWLLVIRRIVLN